MPAPAALTAMTRRLRRLAGHRNPSTAELQARLARYEAGWPPGHFYSPIPDLDDVRRREAEIFPAADTPLPGIDTRQSAQLALLRELSAACAEQPWGTEGRPGLRYRFDNPNFQQGEALVLLGLLRLERPRRVIEVGSGWSSCALLDGVDRFLDGAVHCTFVEPNPQLLRELTPGDDLDVRATTVQETDPRLFDELTGGDMLVIDSTHVVKVGSDVNHLLFTVLPRLAPGVLVHVHDIHHGFEYPRDWVLQGRAWNEVYAVRAFLMYNRAWEIVFFNALMATRHRAAFEACLPPVAQSPGSSLWLRRATSPAPTPDM